MPDLSSQRNKKHLMKLTPEQHQYLDKLREDIRFSAHLRAHHYQFRSTWGLFSPKGIDEGSQLLLDHLEIRRDERAVDLGCGYGPLGLVIAREAPEGYCALVDKDFVAVEYSRINAELNGIPNTETFLSNGFSHVDQRPLSLVVSNLPAKTGKELYYLYFYDALSRLEPGGRFYVVVINGLRKFIARAFTEVFGNHKKLKQGKTYTVAVARIEKDTP